MRLVAAHRTPLAESDGRAPSSSVTRLRGNFFMLRDPVRAAVYVPTFLMVVDGLYTVTLGLLTTNPKGP